MELTTRIGRYTARTLVAGRFRLDGGSMFGIVPQVLWQRALQPDARNRIEMVTRVLWLSDGEKNILVDVGLGSKWNTKKKRRYAIEDLELPTVLARYGCKPDEITDVVVTHLHFDHCGGLTCRNRDGGIQPVFANAVHHVQKAHWSWARDPAPKDRGSFVADDFLPLEGTIELNLLDGPQELFFGVRVIPVEGHTAAMQLVSVDGPKKKLLFGADLFPTRFHLAIAWNMAFDNAPLKTISEKQRFLAACRDAQRIIVLEHDPQMAAVWIRDEKGGFNEVVEAGWVGA
jgi:glyoxylase-like metal-dependent hydrolase (beta-lactamase superfamily II)